LITNRVVDIKTAVAGCPTARAYKLLQSGPQGPTSLLELAASHGFSSHGEIPHYL
jgi:hypothetical protein